MEQIFVGIDVSKDKSTYIAINSQGGKILGPTTVVNSRTGIDKIIGSLKAYHPGEILFAMEVSSNYWENIWLKSYPTAVHIAMHASVSKLVKIFRKYQGCNFGASKAKDLIDAAKSSFYSGRAYSTRGLTLSMQLDEISSLEAKIKIICDKLREILAPKDSHSSDFDILNSIKGIGLGTIATFIACIGDVSRFSSSSKLISYVGLYPKIFESGKYKKKNPSMVKAGPKELRYMLYLSSVTSIKHNAELRKYYLDRVSAGMPGKKALIKVAVKIAK
jgi:transposase